MTRVVLTELHPGKVEHLRVWSGQLVGARRQEAVESLRREQVQRETAFLVKIQEKFYVLHLTESESEPLPADLSMPVNVEHRQVNREVMKPDTRTTAEVLYDLSADSSLENAGSSGE